MNGSLLLIGSLLIFLAGYFVYGRWLAKTWGVDETRKPPAVAQFDGVDYVPTKPIVLTGHHFSSIAGAGPIVGPITAAVFGWVPVVLWVIIGCIFFGSPHDFGSLFASVRNKGQGIGTIINETIGARGKFLFAVFAYVCLLIVIAAFANIVAATFVASPQSATSSLLFIALAICFGYSTYRFQMSLALNTVLGIVLMVGAIALGHIFPLALTKNVWVGILMLYVVAASVMPVWLLLQPRDYLNSFLLYGCIIFAFFGILIYQPTLNLPAFTSFDPSGAGKNPLFPMLFITVACGAISGFHSLVASGTTSKQLASEDNALAVGYGSMLIEGVLAIVAVIAVGYVGSDKLIDLLKHGGPVNVFADGIGTFMTVLGFDFTVAKSFISLSISAFAMTTLDTSTRLARFILQEVVTPKGMTPAECKNPLANMYVATIVTVIFAGYMSLGSYLSIWPVFGVSNQLLAALSLLAVAAWLKKSSLRYNMLIVPMLFMFTVCFVSLAEIIRINLALNIITASLGIILFFLAIALVFEAKKTMLD